MIKESIFEAHMTIANIYIPNISVPKYIKQILPELKGEIDNTIVEVFTSIRELQFQKWIDHRNRKSISKH